MEVRLMSLFFAQKQIMNPANPEEVFECKDLVQGEFLIAPMFCLINRQITFSAKKRRT